MSRKKKPKRRKHRRGNVAAERHYDPFPKTGLVKQYEPFIRKRAAAFCKQYPGQNREQVLFRAVEIAFAAEKAFKPELGYDFSTYLGYRLKDCTGCMTRRKTPPRHLFIIPRASLSKTRRRSAARKSS